MSEGLGRNGEVPCLEGLTEALPKLCDAGPAFDAAAVQQPCGKLPMRAWIVPDAGVRFAYRLRPDERGDFGFDGVHLRLHSPWRLWRQRRVAGTAQRVRVFPNFAPLARLALLGAEQASRTQAL